METVETIVASPFAVLPDDLRNVAAPALFNGRRRPFFLEGPAFDRAGDLHLVDIPNGRVLRLDSAGRFSVTAEYDGQPNGLAVHRDGRLFIADRRRGLMVLDPAEGEPRTVVDGIAGEPFRGLNDLLFAPDGTLYFTDQGASDLVRPDGRLLRLRPDGSLEVLIGNIPSPNGVALSAGGDVLYLAVTRANAVWRVPLGEFGGEGIGRTGLYIQLSGGVGPDGLAASRAGHLAVAHIGTGAVPVFDPEGMPFARIRSPRGRLVTNLAFAPGTGALYITESETGTVLRAELPFEGLSPFSHA